MSASTANSIGRSTIMMDRPNMFGTKDFSSSENANPWSDYNNHKKALEDYYGQAKAETVQDPDAVYPRDRTHFPEAFTGPNLYMRRLLMGYVTQDQQWPSVEALPMTPYNGNPHVIWSEIEFHNHMLDVSPEETLARTLTFEKRQNEGFIQRYSANFQMVHGFYLTEEGRAHYVAHIQQIANMTTISINFGILHTLFNTKPYDDPHSRSRTDNPLTNADITSRFHEQKATFGALQKSFTNYKMILNKAQTAAQNRNNSAADLFIWPSNAAQYVNDQPVNNTYITSGNKITDQADVFTKDKDSLGAKFRFSRPFVLESNRPAVDPCIRNITIGGFVNVTSEPCEILLSQKKFQWSFMDVEVYDENSDTFKCISFKRIFQYSGLFNNFGNQCNDEPKQKRITSDEDDFAFGADEDDDDSGVMGLTDLIGQSFFKGYTNFVDWFDSHTCAQDVIEYHYASVLSKPELHQQLSNQLVQIASRQNKQIEYQLRQSIKELEANSAADDEIYDNDTEDVDDTFTSNTTQAQLATIWALKAKELSGYDKTIASALANISSATSKIYQSVLSKDDYLPENYSQSELVKIYSVYENLFWQAIEIFLQNKTVPATNIPILDGNEIIASGGANALRTIGNGVRAPPYVLSDFQNGSTPSTLGEDSVKAVDGDFIILFNLKKVFQTFNETSNPTLGSLVSSLVGIKDIQRFSVIISFLFEQLRTLRNNVKKSTITNSSWFIDWNTKFSLNEVNEINLSNIAPVQIYIKPIVTVLKSILTQILDPAVTDDTVINIAKLQTAIQQGSQFRFMDKLSGDFDQLLDDSNRYDKFESFDESVVQQNSNEALKVIDETLKAFPGSKSSQAKVSFGIQVFQNELVDIYNHLVFLARDRANFTGDFATLVFYKESFKNVVNHIITTYGNSQNTQPFKTSNLYLNSLLTFLENEKDSDAVDNGLLNPAGNQKFLDFMLKQRRNQINEINKNNSTSIAANLSVSSSKFSRPSSSDIKNTAQRSFSKFGKNYIDAVVLGWSIPKDDEIGSAILQINKQLGKKGNANTSYLTAVAVAAFIEGETAKNEKSLEIYLSKNLISEIKNIVNDSSPPTQKPNAANASTASFQFTKQTYRKLLKQLPINGQLIKWCFDNDVYFPIDLKLVWPHEQYETASGLLMFGGGATGKTLYNEPEFMIANEAGRMVHYWHWALKFGFLIFRPDLIINMNNIIVNDYRGGRGIKPFDPLSKFDVIKYREGLITKDCFVIPERVDKRNNEILFDITGSFHPDLKPNDQAQQSTSYTVSSALASIWGWSTHRRKHPLDDQFIDELSAPEYNTMCWSNWHRHRSPITGQFEQEFPETGHLRECIYEGSGQVRKGAQMFYRGNDVSIRLK